ncbi:MAG TPA: DUF3501 family protein [Polyangia bacterium]|jgi:hypothetical protein
MRKLTLSDIKGPRLYAPIRDDFRRRIIEEKKHRRVTVGDRVTLVFENRHTMMFQVEEMLRVEEITDPRGIQHELDIYNPLIPGPNELSATLLIEITDQAHIRAVLDSLIGLDQHTALAIAGARIPAEFEPGHSEEDRIAAVQYVRFRLTPAQAQAMAPGGPPVALLVDHPRYEHRTTLPDDVRAALAQDLASE